MAAPPVETRERIKRPISIELIDNLHKRRACFRKRRDGLLKKAADLATLTGTQCLVLVAGEPGQIYCFATAKLRPMVDSAQGHALLGECLKNADALPVSDAHNAWIPHVVQ